MSDNQVQIIIEYFDQKFDSLIEAFQVMTQTITTDMARDSDLQTVKADVATIKLAVTTTNQDLHKLEKRVDHLEAVAHHHA